MAAEKSRKPSRKRTRKDSPGQQTQFGEAEQSTQYDYADTVGPTPKKPKADKGRFARNNKRIVFKPDPGQEMERPEALKPAKPAADCQQNEPAKEPAKPAQVSLIRRRRSSWEIYGFYVPTYTVRGRQDD